MTRRVLARIPTGRRCRGGLRRRLLLKRRVAEPRSAEWEEILACEQAGITPYVPKPLTSGTKAEGRFGKQDFVYIAEEDEYRCPAGERLTWRFDNVEHGLILRNYWANGGLACPKSAIYPFGGRLPRRYGRESRRAARMVTALGRSCAGAGRGRVFSREHCGRALVRHPDEGVHLAKFPGKLAPGIACIGAAEDLTVDATGQQKIGVGSVRG
jgi:hypothetical protein